MSQMNKIDGSLVKCWSKGSKRSERRENQQKDEVVEIKVAQNSSKFLEGKFKFKIHSAPTKCAQVVSFCTQRVCWFFAFFFIYQIGTKKTHLTVKRIILGCRLIETYDMYSIKCFLTKNGRMIAPSSIFWNCVSSSCS